MDAATEIVNFAASLWTVELIDQLPQSKDERDQMIALAATYGPAITDRTAR